jgi:hypothetical protein
MQTIQTFSKTCIKCGKDLTPCPHCSKYVSLGSDIGMIHDDMCNYCLGIGYEMCNCEKGE